MRSSYEPHARNGLPESRLLVYATVTTAICRAVGPAGAGIARSLLNELGSTNTEYGRAIVMHKLVLSAHLRAPADPLVT